ncbi:MAG: signal peptide peptidase SppA [Bacteroidota bacterium]
MQQFFKFLFASCLGTLIALFCLLFIVVGGIGAIAGAAEAPVSISANSVLHLQLDQPIPELTDNIQTTQLELKPTSSLGLHAITDAIDKAAADDDIKGIFLESPIIGAGFTSSGTIRKALNDFRASGKFIYTHAPYYEQTAYYLASVSDQIALAPLGMVDWRGFSVQYMFYKDVLDRLDIHYEVFYAGRYKSASEPYRRNSMSDASKEQSRAFLDEMHNFLFAEVGTARNISMDKLTELSNSYAAFNSEVALNSGLVDKLAYREEVIDDMRDQLGLAEDKKVSLVDVNDYHMARVANQSESGERIALLIAEGMIVDGEGQASQIGDADYVELIDDIREDDEIKAVVLRINSGGGSAMSSDHIWKALMDLKETAKPLVVSMGAVAASGGYYIAAPADRIYAEPTTITGSIGVVGAIPQLQNFMKNKIGVHMDSVRTGPFATGIGILFDMSPAEKELIQANTYRTYEVFKSRVVEGRGMDQVVVDSIAQGRVWVGTAAKEIGLVDELGSLDDAVAHAAELANLEEYRTVVYPKPVAPWERLINDLMDVQTIVTRSSLQEKLGPLYPHYRHLEEIGQSYGPQARLPFVVDF